MRPAKRWAIGALLALPGLVGAGLDLSEEMKAYDQQAVEPAPAAKAPKAAAAALKAEAAPADPWAALQAGNRRWQAGAAQGPHRGGKRRAELAKGQHPMAMVLACADSRVAPELLFDQGLGDLFVVRVAGNVAGPFDRASLEYGAEHLHIPLLVILGHESCGAVKASLETAADPKAEAGLSPDLKALVQEIRPAVQGKQGPAALDEAVRENAKLSSRRLLEQSAVLRNAVAEGHLRVVTARYDLDSGAVEALP